MKIALTFMLSLFSLFSNAAQTVKYQVNYAKNMPKSGLTITVTTTLSKPADSSYFYYANEIWGEENLFQSISNFKGAGKGYRFRMVPDSNRIVVYHPTATTVSFSYTVRQDYPGDSPNIFARPRLQPTFFHALGQSLFVMPEAVFESGKEDPEMDATIDWIGFPKEFAIHNMLGSQELHQSFNGKLWTEFYNTLFVGGDYRIHSFEHQNKKVYFAIRGNWTTFQDDQLLALFQRTLITQRDFWNDQDFDYYTVIMTPTLTSNDSIMYPGQSVNGSRIYNGFMIQSTNNPFNDLGTIKYIFNHEMMHDWIGGKITMAHEELNYWFSEGFTDYYAYKNQLRNGALTPEEWRAKFNEDVLKAHYINPERNEPNYRIKDDFWTNYNIEKLPYRRGTLFAFWLDQQLLVSSNGKTSLDDFMRTLLIHCTENEVLFTDELFLDLLQQQTGEDWCYFFQKYVISGVDFDWSKLTMADGIALNQTEDGFPQLEFTETESVFKEAYLMLKK
ncbi:MAG: peptidase [Candidatus Fluviicola riflensis]|nr:MAG: peptidase [Candidatus Fluviicola riflensis]OGS76424.1 MAG: peptidase [Candidatus Fluviicola riflensis]OGS82718.1 MAG: peptidase [Fluviicola sp. RIFCSPHIGHO2_01_FULL_43_53]OGS89017.1 MAG: peptidase [Fluviicola sp. RIFCSPHIGHO2_12_FULL_43_24]